MKEKHLKILAIIGTFLLAFPIHFGYTIFPNSITSIFFPVNESIWEHMKILYTSILLYGLIDYILFQKNHLKTNNFITSLAIPVIISVPLYLLLYLPLYYKIGENTILNLSVLLLVFILMENLSYFIRQKNNLPIWNIVSSFLIIIGYIIFGYLTYHPIEAPLFFDTTKEKYGINLYKLTSQEPNHLQHNDHLEPSYHHVDYYKIYY